MVCTHVAAQTYTNRVAYLLPSIDLELKLADMRLSKPSIDLLDHRVLSGICEKENS
jgi:hypothetical protein